MNTITNKGAIYYTRLLKGLNKAVKEHRCHQIDKDLLNKAFKDIDDGMSKSATARKYHISRQTIYRYMKKNMKNSKEVIQDD